MSPYSNQSGQDGTLERGHHPELGLDTVPYLPSLVMVVVQRSLGSKDASGRLQVVVIGGEELVLWSFLGR
ncbi:hypothetical protein E2C01_077277 [Portunus trituberculatus]|uniref:Uncharacterized protein n=1 Tax=Portunus trituberculatus TaxID=210409 RepID=A0A5B7IFF6_PORTR|nr:hypothetical protein [Portunus trituberculatus]